MNIDELGQRIMETVKSMRDERKAVFDGERLDKDAWVCSQGVSGMIGRCIDENRAVLFGEDKSYKNMLRTIMEIDRVQEHVDLGVPTLTADSLRSLAMSTQLLRRRVRTLSEALKTKHDELRKSLSQPARDFAARQEALESKTYHPRSSR